MVRVALKTTLVILVLVLSMLTWGDWWPVLSQMAVDNIELLEALGYIVGILASIIGAGGAILYWMSNSGGKEEEEDEEEEETDEGGSLPGEPRLREDRFGKVLDNYLRWVVARHDRARLHGLVELKQSRGKRQRLGDIYTSLKVRHRLREADGRERGGEGAHPQGMIRGRGGEGAQEMEREVDMGELLTLSEQIAIIGGAGSGKTTYLDFVASQLAAGRLGEGIALMRPQSLEEWPIPFLVPLRFWNVYRELCKQQPNQLQDAEQGTLIGFLLWYLRTNYNDFEQAEAFFEHLLEQGEVLLMFDGLDEVVSVEERQIVRSEIDNLLIHPLYQRHRCLVTAREAGYKSAPFGEEFLRCDIQPMSEEQIERLVKQWCEQLPDMEANAEVDILAIIKQMNEERKKKGQPPLVATPLMVTMIVSVRYSQRELPKERAKLYDVVVNVILQKQYGADADAHGARQALITWGGAPDKQREWLSHLAFQMQRRGVGGALADEMTVRQILTDALEERGEADKVAPFIRVMRQRGGLFEERGEQFQFMHLSFQEFLAAQYLATQWREHRDQLAQWVKDSWWRETLLLTIGSLDSPIPFSQRNALIEGLLELGGSLDAESIVSAADAETIVSAAELVALGLLDLREPENSLIQRARQRLVQLFQTPDLLHATPPPLREAAGIALALIGDPRQEIMTVDGMQFCYVPPGPFWMGSNDGRDDEKPLHQVDLPDGYWISRYPISNAQFELFVQAGGYAEERFWREAKVAGVWKDGKVKDWRDEEPRSRPYNYGSPFTLPNHPVVGVTWYEALAFTRWLTARWGQTISLPSEAEWEKAARGGEVIPAAPLIRPATHLDTSPSLSTMPNPLPQRRNPWGDEAHARRSNTRESGIGHTNALGCFPRDESPNGCLEMAGNVWEWTRSLYQPYPYQLHDGREQLDAPRSEVRSLRGVSWLYVSTISVGCLLRYWFNPSSRRNFRGFRVFRPPIPLISGPSGL
jgi:formylglycine-generating enzyme required for sulfatase activity